MFPPLTQGKQMFLPGYAITSAAKILQKMLYNKTSCGTNTLVKVTRQSLYKAKSLACSLASRDTPVAATLQRKSSGGISSTMTTDYYKRECSKELFCNEFGQDGMPIFSGISQALGGV